MQSIIGNSDYSGFVVFDDVYKICARVVGKYMDGSAPAPTISDFLVEVEKELQSVISTHCFFTNFSGMLMEEANEFSVGSVTVMKPRLSILKEASGYEERVESVWKHANHGLWLTCELKGSRLFAEQRFFENAISACGTLAIACAATAPRGAVGIRLIPSIEGRSPPSVTRWFSIDKATNNLCDNTSRRGFLPIKVSDSWLSDLQDQDWFKELTAVTTGTALTETQLALRRSIFWFFDAQAEPVLEMQLLKFWSCVECIFSFENTGEITKKIIDGLSVLLTLGPYQFSDHSEIAMLKKNIDDLYEKRSTAVHDAQHGHVHASDVISVSKWAAMVILNVATLSINGYSTRLAIKSETDRLIGLSNRR